MTSPRDALRALEKIKSILGPAVPKCCQGGQAEITYALQMIDELTAILSQMDSEPTVPEGSALDTEHEKSIYARCDDCGQLLPHCACDEETTTSSEPTVAQWREGVFKFLKAHWPAPNRVPYPAYKIADLIEQEARELAAKEKQL